MPATTRRVGLVQIGEQSAYPDLLRGLGDGAANSGLEDEYGPRIPEDRTGELEAPPILTPVGPLEGNTIAPPPPPATSF